MKTFFAWSGLIAWVITLLITLSIILALYLDEED